MAIVLVTGGIRGIGGAISKSFSSKGDCVIANYLQNHDLARLFFEETGIPVYQWDVSSAEACEVGIKKVEEIYGPIDVLVNNAGITQDALLSKMTLEQWRTVISTNLDSLFYMCKPVIKGMIERSKGRIINISSVNGVKGQRGQTNYSAAKAGVIGFTKSLAQEVASYGITVNALAPGYIRTTMIESVPDHVLEKIMQQIPLKRMGIPEEIGAMVTFLASQDASFITGSTFHINGGQWMGH